MLLKFNCSSIALLTMRISYCCHIRVLYWVYTDPYCFIYWEIRKNILQETFIEEKDINDGLMTEKYSPSFQTNTENQVFQDCPTRKDNTESLTLRLTNFRLKSGFTVKYSLSPREIPRLPPWGFPSCSGYISPYIPTCLFTRLRESLAWSQQGF